MTTKRFLLLAALHAQWSNAQKATITLKARAEKAIIPTASGQIGINPVTDIPPESYKNIGLNTEFYQQDGDLTKWIGVNTEYLTDLPYTTVVEEKTSVTTVQAAVVAETATASGKDIAPGDVSIAFSPKLLDALNKLVDKAEAACGGKKRQSCDVNQRFAQLVSEEAQVGGTLDFIDAEVAALLPTVTAGDVAAIMEGAKVAGTFVSVVLAWKLLGKLEALTLSAASMLSSNGDDNDDQCPADAPKDAEAPFCPDDECKGDNTKRDQKCTAGKYKNCPCLAVAEVVGPIDGDTKVYDDGKDWMDEQQQIIADVGDSSSDGPFCLHGASPSGDRVPTEYCQCGEDPTKKTITLSVASSTASPYNPCPYTDANGPTVTFGPKSTPTPTDQPTATPSVKCNDPQERSMTQSDGLDFADQFCTFNTQGDSWSYIRLPPAEGFSNAVINYYNVDKDPMVRIYAYQDTSDECKDKTNVHIAKPDCVAALDAILKDCNKDTEDKKMGGEAVINCQHYYFTALKGPGNTNCATCGSKYKRFWGKRSWNW